MTHTPELSLTGSVTLGRLAWAERIAKLEIVKNEIIKISRQI